MYIFSFWSFHMNFQKISDEKDIVNNKNKNR